MTTVNSGGSPASSERILRRLGGKSTLISSLVATLIMAVVTMGFVNPAIDGHDGAGLLALQLAFDKEIGSEIIKSWGVAGRAMFVRWIFTDSLYAAAYAVFLAALISSLLLRKGRQGSRYFQATVLMALLAGACDWLENTLELAFIQNPAEFSSTLFRLHSLVALLKWAGVVSAIIAIIILLATKTRQRNS